MTQVTQVHMVGGTQHEHIASVRWVNGTQSGESTRAQMVEFIDGGGQACVSGGGTTAYVGVVNASPKYIRTHADGKWNDNLLALPRY